MALLCGIKPKSLAEVLRIGFFWMFCAAVCHHDCPKPSSGPDPGAVEPGPVSSSLRDGRGLGGGKWWCDQGSWPVGP